MKGLFKDAAIVFPKFNPTVKQTINPGPAVAAIASISSSFILLSEIAFSAYQINFFSTCALAANSGTTPPNSL